MTTLFCVGKPVTQGSKRAWARMGRNGKPFASMVEQNAGRLRPWRDQIRWVAQESGQECLEGPVAVRLRFFFVRPKNHYVSGDRSKPLKATAPPRPHGNIGDLDKLTRAVLDALTGVLYVDDCQVCEWGPGTGKYYGDEPGVEFEVYQVPPVE